LTTHADKLRQAGPISANVRQRWQLIGREVVLAFGAQLESDKQLRGVHRLVEENLLLHLVAFWPDQHRLNRDNRRVKAQNSLKKERIFEWRERAPGCFSFRQWFHFFRRRQAQDIVAANLNQSHVCGWQGGRGVIQEE